MSFHDIMRRVLPQIENVSPHVTSEFLSTDRPKGTSNPHMGIDFNYFGGQKAPINLSHPTVRAPIDGVVVFAGGGTAGRITIRDSDGYRHEILHTHSQHVKVGDRVSAGQLIGTMGNMGVLRKGVENGAHHVHYQIIDPAGNQLSPSGFWDQPEFLKQFRRYLESRDANAGPQAANTEQAANEEFGPTAPLDVKPETRYLGRRIAGQPESVVPDKPGSLDERFGNWNSSGGASAPFGLGQLVPPEQNRPRGIFSDEPIPAYPVPLPIWGFPDPSEKPGAEEWSLARRGPADWNGNRKRR